MDDKFRLKEVAQARGFTQEDLQIKSGVKISTLRRIWQNKGVEEPRSGTMRALANALGVSVEELYNPAYQPRENGSSLPDKRMSLAGAPA